MKSPSSPMPSDNQDEFSLTEEIQVRVAFTDRIGDKHADMTLSPDLTADQVVEHLKQADSLPFDLNPDQIYNLSLKRTNQAMTPDQTLRNIGITDGDTIIVDAERRGGRSAHIRSFREIQLLEAVLSNRGLLEEWSGLYTLLLYTVLDKQVTHYVRAHLRELCEMSGGGCLFFVMESPVPQSQLETRERSSAYLRADSFRPVKRIRAYELGQNLGVKPSQFPCAVVFSGLRKRSVLIVPIIHYVDVGSETPEEELTMFFEKLFSSISAVVHESERNRLSELERLLKGVSSPRIKYMEPLRLSKLALTVIEAITTIVDTIIQ